MENPAPMQTLTQSHQLSALPRRKLNSFVTFLPVSIILLAFNSQCQSSFGLVRGAAAFDTTNNLVCPRGFFLAED